MMSPETKSLIDRLWLLIVSIGALAVEFFSLLASFALVVLRWSFRSPLRAIVFVFVVLLVAFEMWESEPRFPYPGVNLCLEKCALSSLTLVTDTCSERVDHAGGV